MGAGSTTNLLVNYGQGVWDDEDDPAPPRRWYAPGTQRGKVILVVTVAVVLVVLVVGCCIGIGGIGELKRIDMFGFV